MQNILVTGSAGFIGSNLVLRLLDGKQPVKIVGLDNMNNYYDPSLKEYRLSVISSAVEKSHGKHQYQFVKGDLADKALIDKLFAEHKFDIVVNLAAQAGVRYSIENPDAYIQSNIIGFYNILERHNGTKEKPAEHEHLQDFIDSLQEGEELRYATSKFEGTEKERKTIEAAMIYAIKPEINNKNTVTYNDDPIRIEIEGTDSAFPPYKKIQLTKDSEGKWKTLKL